MSMDEILNNTPAGQTKAKRNTQYEKMQRVIDQNKVTTPLSSAFKPEVKVLLASNSEFKLADLSKLLEVAGNVAQTPVRYRLLDYRDLIEQQNFDENKNSLAENALEKARALKKLVKDQDYFVLADDSGLFIDQLPDQFGVKTARQLSAAGQNDPSSINKYLLNLVSDLSPDNRTAHMQSAIALIDNNGLEYQATGRGGVRIAEQERGILSTGLDKIIETETGQTLAEMDDQQRFAFSHRGRTILNLLKSMNR